MVVLSTVKNLFSRSGSVSELITRRLPRAYLGLAILTALFGYTYLLAFPVLLLTGLYNIYYAVALGETIDWQSAIAWSVVAPLAGLVIYRSLQARPKAPVGLVLTNDKAPELFTLAHKLRSHYKRTAIHRIVVTGNYEVDIVKTPRWALPLRPTCTLVIGLPVMQCLSPEQFECMLATRIGQFSKKHNLLTNWLYELRMIWQQYRIAYSRLKGFGSEPLKYFFRFYAPLYAKASAFAAKQDLLHADTYAMDLFNDEKVRDMITTDAVCRWYLKYQFWPAVYKAAAAQPKSLPTPHARMAAAVYGSMTGDKLKPLMIRAIKHRPSAGDIQPPLQSRIENIGHEKARMGKHANEIAAARYLGPSMKAVIDVIDKLWLKSYLAKRKSHHQRKPDGMAPQQVSNA